MNIQLRVTGVTPITRRFTRFNQFLNLEMNNVTKKEASDGAKFMVSLMPKQHRRMVEAVTVEKKDAKSWSIISRTPKGQNKGNLRPYHIYYNYGARGWYTGGVQSGETHYYERTAEYMGEKFPRSVTEKVKKILNMK
jgi:hypothetical protein